MIKKSNKKIRVGVIFGGRSGEHEVSLVSALSVIKNLDRNKYEVVPIGITKKGRWLIGENLLEQFKKGSHIPALSTIMPFPGSAKKNLVSVSQEKNAAKYQNKAIKIDVFFPVLHGPYGEDGTIQGLFEMLDTPYVGSGVLGSSIGMDKIVQKQLFKQVGLPIVKFIWFLKKDLEKSKEKIIKKIEKEIGYPCFIKPANLGSSVGITKAKNRSSLSFALVKAAKFDQRILIEEAVQNAREIEVSVLGNDKPKVSIPGEIIPSREFYDYFAKYIDNASRTIIPAELSQDMIKKIQEYSLTAFQTINAAGMARVDFLVNKKTNKIYLSEINTIPGFTSISMYPKLWQASGLSFSKLIDRLIRLAFERAKEKKKLKTSYDSGSKWYRSS